MAIPRPGKAVRGSRSGRPIMAALDLLGRRWALRVVWELRDGALSFRALQERCDAMSPSVLMRRLDELRATDIVATDPAGGYGLTGEGRALLRALAPLDAWARAWARSSYPKPGARKRPVSDEPTTASAPAHGRSKAPR